MQVGQIQTVQRIFSQGDFDRFAALSGDDNPIHIDPEFSAQTKFGQTVAHGMLLYSTVCAALNTRLPGPGTLQLRQELMFPNPTYTGEEITIRLEVTETQPAHGLLRLSTTVVKPGGAVGLQGQTLVRLPGKPLPAQPTNPPTHQATIHHPVRSASAPGSLASARSAGGFANSAKGQPTNSSLKGLEVGQRAETRRTFTARDLDEYADLTGDNNPILVDARFARQSGLAGRIIPGGLLGGLFSYLLGTALPGRGTNYLKQRLEFPKPAHPDQQLTTSVEIIRIRPEKQLVNLRTLCINPAGELVCHGEALVLVSDVGAP
jgi:acyl dehydratase